MPVNSERPFPPKRATAQARRINTSPAAGRLPRTGRLPRHLMDKLLATVRHWLKNHHRKIPTAAVVLLVPVVLAMMAFSGRSASRDFETALSQRTLLLPPRPLASFSGAEDERFQPQRWQEVVVQKGQTLSGIFKQLGFSAGLLHRIVTLDKNTRKLARIYPGARLFVRRGENNKLAALKYPLDETTDLVVTTAGDTVRSELISHPLEIQLEKASGVIEHSLFGAGKAAGLSDNMVMKLANIFGWDIDFVLDIRKGDRFSVIYEKIYKDGEFLRDGRILAASFTNQGETFRSVYYDPDNDPATDDGNYYTPEGRSMKKAFLRAPLNFSYISSNFNPRRLHPILKRVRPHNGIDYRAPRGTPVYAAGDGKVIRSAYSKYNGNHVFIQHPNGIVTKYLHFSKRKVRKGQRVKQGQVIGTVGSTGLASGPHLHYEFLVNGVHRNPRTVKLPKADPLPKARLADFQRFAAPLLAELQQLDEHGQSLARQ